ncbi:hypothetical protein BD770DRAFT_429039 [Pilaira anomala]|nr:hypothetical protein BD770DRAFT_429039 [Pilaira anomala]
MNNSRYILSNPEIISEEDRALWWQSRASRTSRDSYPACNGSITKYPLCISSNQTSSAKKTAHYGGNLELQEQVEILIPLVTAPLQTSSAKKTAHYGGNLELQEQVEILIPLVTAPLQTSSAKKTAHYGGNLELQEQVEILIPLVTAPLQVDKDDTD